MEDRGHKQLNSRQLIGIFPVLNFDIDDVDVPLASPCITKADIFWLVCSIFMHIIDMAIDIFLAIRYLLDNKVTYFAWTSTFIILPSLINVIISRRMEEHDNNKTILATNQPEPSKCTCRMFMRRFYYIALVLFQLAPVLCYCKTLKYALRARKFEKMGDRNGQRRYYFKMLKEDQDVSFLRVLECFLEAAPQQILQLTILLKHYHNSINFQFFHQSASILSSLGSMGWAMASYQRSIRLAQKDKQNLGITGTTLQFFWHFCTTVSRIFSLSVIASMWPLYTAIACLCHWMCMSTWIIVDSRGILEFCRNFNHSPHSSPTIGERIHSMAFSIVLGVVHVFIYLNIVDGKTFLKYIFFYVLSFLENVTACGLWMYFASNEVKNAWYFNLLIVLCTVPFLLGIISMIIYYIVFHPSLKRQNY